MRKPVAFALLVFAVLLLTPAAGQSDTREDGTLRFFKEGSDQYDFYVFGNLRREPVQNRLFDGWRLVDPDTGIETILPIRSESAFDGNLIVGCEAARMVVFNLATDSIEYDLSPDGLPSAWSAGCDIRDGKVYSSHADGVMVLDLSDLSTTVLTFPGHSRIFIRPALGSEDNMLHVNSLFENYDIDLSNPTALLGPRFPRMFVTDHTNSTFDTEGSNIVEYDRHRTPIRTVPCPSPHACSGVNYLYPLDHDRLFIQGNRRMRILDLTSGDILAEIETIASHDIVRFVDAQYLYMSVDSNAVRIDRDAAYITKAPDLVDLRTSSTAFFQTWSLFEPVVATVNGVPAPVTRSSAGVDIDLSSAATGAATVTVTFANGATTPPVTLEVIALPTWKTITVTGHDIPGDIHSATISMRCTGVHGQGEERTVSSNQTISFDVPVGAPCEATAGGGRFGPLYDGEFVIDYSTAWPDLDLGDLGDPGDDWHVWVGADNAYPVHWVILDKSAGSITERPATIRCGVGDSGSRRGTLQYGQISRFVRDFTPSGGVNSCRWSFDEVPGFDGTKIETFGPITKIPYVYHGDSSTLTIVSDYLIHPDTGPEAFLNAVNRRANGRASNAGELNWWIPRITNNAGFRGLAVDAIIRGDEYRSRTETIARLYQAYFDRLPDASGLAYWADVAARGTSLLEIADYFAQSEEFRRKYGEADNNRFVLLAYENVLARPPDAAGYDYWLETLDDRVLDGPEVLFYFSDSAEFRTVMRDRLAVTGTYTLVLNRAPTEAELNAGIESFRSTGSLASLANTLIASPGYADSFATYLRP